MATKIQGGNNMAGLANVDANFNLTSTSKDANGNSLSKTQRAQILASQEAVLMAGRNDDNAINMRVDRNGNIITGNFIPEIFENFEGATLNVQKWTQAVTAFVTNQATLTGLQHNSTAITTVSAVSVILSQRLFTKNKRVPLHFKLRKRHSMVSGAISDFGFGVPTTTTLVVPNGCCLRMTNSSILQGVITYNNVEIAIANIVSRVASNGNTIGGALNMSNAYYTSNYFVYDIIADDDTVIFTIQDTSTGELIGTLNLPVPNAYQKMWGATALPIYDRLYNNTAPSTAPINITTDLVVNSTDMNINMDASQIAGNLGLTASRSPFTGAQLENHTNSTAPVSATLSNTTAGYATLGGKFQFATVAGAVTDFALFGFQIPAGAKFLCEGVTVNTYNTGATVATTASALEWAMGFNSSAISLATANIIRKQVGVQAFQIGAVAGQDAKVLDINFVTPEVTESGRFVQVILNLPIGTATASQIIRGQVTIKGRFI